MIRSPSVSTVEAMVLWAGPLAQSVVASHAEGHIFGHGCEHTIDVTPTYGLMHGQHRCFITLVGHAFLSI